MSPGLKGATIFKVKVDSGFFYCLCKFYGHGRAPVGGGAKEGAYSLNFWNLWDFWNFGSS